MNMMEALPGGVSLFAEAYRRQTGKDLGVKGSDDIKALLKAMKDRNVKGDILTFAAQVAAERAAPGLSAASKASQAEQARFQNRLADQSIVASNAGVEEGFARIFRTLNIVMKESTPMVESLARAFNEATKYFSMFALIPQSIKRAFEGRDSWFADIVGPKGVEFAKSIKDTMMGLGKEIKETFSIVIEGWNQIFSTLGPNILGAIQKFGDILRLSLKMLNSYVSGDTTSATNAAAAIRGIISGESPENIKRLESGQAAIKPKATDSSILKDLVSVQQRINSLPEADGFWQGAAKASTMVGLNIDKASLLNQLADSYSNNKNSPMFGDVAGARAFAQDQLNAAMTQSGNYTNNVSIGRIEIHTQATDAQGIARDIEPHIFRMIHESRASEYSEALLNMPQTE